MKRSGDKHYITEAILRLVRQSIADNRGSKAAFCRQTGITPYNLSKLLSGNKRYVFGDDWNRLCDYFPELDDRPAAIREWDTDAAVENFRSALLQKLIQLNIDPVAKDTVLREINAFQRPEH